MCIVDVMEKQHHFNDYNLISEAQSFQAHDIPQSNCVSCLPFFRAAQFNITLLQLCSSEYCMSASAV